MPSLPDQLKSALAAAQAVIAPVIQQAQASLDDAQATIAQQQKQISDLKAQINVGPSFLPPGDITALVNQLGAKAKSRAFLTPGAAYQIGGGQIAQPGVEITCPDPTNPAKITLLQGRGSGIDVHGADFRLSGVNVTGAGRFMVARTPGLWLHDVTCDALNTLLALLPGADLFDIENVSAGKQIGGDLVYCVGSNGRLVNVRCAGITSPGERCIRFDQENGTRPTNNTVIGCELWNNNGKDTVGVREADGVYFKLCIFHGWNRCGQDDGGAEPNATNIVFEDCQWPDLVPGGQQLNLKNGTTAILRRCLFATDAGQVNISVDANSSVATEDCIRVPVVPGLTLRYGLIVATSPTAKVDEKNTTFREPIPH